jgi:hypothetical protein
MQHSLVDIQKFVMQFVLKGTGFSPTGYRAGDQGL